MGRTRRSFSNEFKRDAVRLVMDSRQSIAQVARDLGIRDTLLGRWKKEAEEQPTALLGQGLSNAEAAELRQLRRENERLRMERDILKKAAAIFSKDSR